MGLQIGSGDQTRAAHFVEEEEGDEDRRMCKGVVCTGEGRVAGRGVGWG